MIKKNYDDAYANAAYIPNADQFITDWTAQASDFRDEMHRAGRAKLGVRYGSTDRQAYDLFLPQTDVLGTVIFVHGGYWRRFDRSFWSHFASGALARGWQVAMPSYDLCPDVSIADITAQIKAAVLQIDQSTTGPITLAGHSAGGHLVARMAQVLPQPVLNRIKHIVPISPVSDLRDLIHTEMNDDFRLTRETAIAESPALNAAPAKPVTVWVGGAERPVFIEQAQFLAKAWACGIVIDPPTHHFNVIDALKSETSEMVQILTPSSRDD
jgi:arylformamidase